MVRWPRTIRQHRSAASASVASAAACGLAAAVLMAPGYPVNSVTMNDGSVWVTSEQQQTVGRLNRQIDRLDAVLHPQTGSFDVLQDGNTVLVTDSPAGTVRIANVAYAQFEPGAVTAPSGSEFALGGGTAAVLDPATGDGWAMPVGEFRSAIAALPADVSVGPGGRVVVGRDGTAHFLSAADDSLVSVAPDGSVRTEPLSVDVPLQAQLSAVGQTAVVLVDSAVLLVGDDVRSVPLEGAGDGPVLQQAGPDADEVVVAGDDAVVGIRLDGRSSRVLISGGGGGAIAPAVVAGCVHAAWSSVPTYARSCGDESVASALPDGVPGSRLVFRVNRTVVALNATGAGSAWILDDAGDARRIDNWNDVVAESVADQQTQSEQDPMLADTLRRCEESNLAPVAVDDEFGVRPGVPAVLPVTANDTDSDTCDVVTIISVSQPPPGQGRLDIVAAGTSLQYTPDPAGVAERIRVEYTIGDGRGHRDSATVTIVVRAPQENDAPQRLRDSTASVEAGKQMATNVLTDWIDPDGDPLILVGASSGSAVLRWSSDGTITILDTGIDAGRLTIGFAVSDGRATSSGTLHVDVFLAGAVLSPIVRNDFASGVVGRPVRIEPLSNDTDPNGDQLRLLGVSRAEGADVSFNAITGAVTITALREGTFLLTYQVTDGGDPVAGTIRFEASAPSLGRPPVAVLDRAEAAPGGIPVLVDVLANDIDPDGDALAVLSAVTPADSGLLASVVDFRLVRLAASRVLAAPVPVAYTITDGSSTVSGRIMVTTTPLDRSEDQPPVARPDLASVRVGDVVSIDVLANDSDPEGGYLTIDPVLVQPPESGLLFAAGTRLRYLAPDEPGTYSAVYQVLDKAQNTATARVTISVIAEDAATNRPPRPRSVAARLVAGTSVEIPIPLAGIDPDGDSAFLVAADSSPSLGTLAPLAPGATSFTYTMPETATAGGVDQFRYRLADRFGAQSVGTVDVVILPRTANQPPVTIDDVVVVTPRRTVNVPVLANDSDPDGDALFLSGSVDTDVVRFGADSITVVVPGTDGWSTNIPYIADDGKGGRTPGLLSVTASSSAVLLPPVAVDDVAGGVEVGATEVTVDVRANDSDPDGTREALVVDLVDRAAGSVSGPLVTIRLQERPRLVPYRITDPDGNTGYAVISVPGTGLARFPVLSPNAVIEATVGVPVVVHVDDVVTDPAGIGLSITDEFVITPGAGTATAIDAESFTFTAAQNAPPQAKVGITVRADDGRTGRIDVPVRIISPENRPPVLTTASVAAARGDGDVALRLTPFAVDPDPDDTVRFSGARAEGAGLSTVRLDGETLIVAAPATTPLGTVTVHYDATDGKAVVTGTVAVTIVETTRPEPRVITGTGFETAPGVPARLRVLDNDFNPFAEEGIPLTIESVQVAGSAGQASTDGEVVTFTPDARFTGTATLTYRVRDAVGRTADGQESVAVSGPPSAPGAPRADTVADNSVTLTWAAPESSNGSPVTVYRVEASGGTATTCPSTTCVIQGLTKGTTYQFRVLAVNGRGESPWSAWSADITPDQVPNAPAAPVVQFGDRSLTVSWQPPNNNGTAITDYLVSVSGRIRSVGNVLTTTLEGLENGTVYDVTVTAVNAAGQSSPSGVTRQSPATVPDAPAVRQPELVESAAGTVLRVSWSNGDDGGSELTKVVVTPYLDGAAQAPHNVASPTATSDEFPVGPGRWAYTVTVTNKAGSATSGLSPQASATAPPAAPSSVVAVAERNQVRFDFVPPPQAAGEPSLTYQVRLVGGTVVAPVAPGQAVSNAALGVTTLGTEGASATFEVRAHNGKDGPWAASNAVIPTGDAQAPDAQAVDVGAEGFRLTWQPAQTNGAAVTLAWGVTPAPGDPLIARMHGADGLRNVDGSADVAQLTCGTQYDIAVWATDGGSAPGNVGATRFSVTTEACPAPPLPEPVPVAVADDTLAVAVDRGPFFFWGGGRFVRISLSGGVPAAEYSCTVTTSDGDLTDAVQPVIVVGADGTGDNRDAVRDRTAAVWDGGGTVVVRCDTATGSAEW